MNKHDIEDVMSSIERAISGASKQINRIQSDSVDTLGDEFYAGELRPFTYYVELDDILARYGAPMQYLDITRRVMPLPRIYARLVHPIMCRLFNDISFNDRKEYSVEVNALCNLIHDAELLNYTLHLTRSYLNSYRISDSNFAKNFEDHEDEIIMLIISILHECLGLLMPYIDEVISDRLSDNITYVMVDGAKAELDQAMLTITVAINEVDGIGWKSII